jgi:protein involved in polysaccharide export with SLBB domain
MTRPVIRLGLMMLLAAFLQAQTNPYQLVKPRPSQTEQANSAYGAPDDCIDCTAGGDGDPPQTPPAVHYPSVPLNDRPNSPSDRIDDPRYEAGRERIANEMATPEAPEPPTEFQRFVQTSTGSLLPIFGSKLFDRVPSTFAPNEVPTNPDYLVGPRDEIELHVWGPVNFSERLTVDAAGDIFLPRAGRVSVSGIKFSQLRDVLHSALGQIYRNFDLNVSMGHLRSMQIFVLGQARRPGAYMVSSLSTLVNAVFASGGPSSRGSLRAVQIKRGGQVITTMDLYDLLLQGDKTKDVALLSGDIIFIPDSGPRVALEGSVESPAIYELKTDTTLGDVLSYAGGLSATAAGQRAIVERIDARSALHSEDIELSAEGLATRPQGGDIIRILPVIPRFERTVSLRGNVADPVRMAWHAGMKVSDLIPSRESLLTRGYWRQHNELVNQDNRDGNAPVTARPSQEQPRNTAGDHSLAAATGQAEPLPLREFVRKNDVQRVAPDIDWHYASIERLNRQNLETRIIAFNLGKAVIDLDPAANLALEPGDVVTVFSRADISVPEAQQTKYVRIEGEINMAGVYSVTPGETLRDLVVRAGGLTPHAYLFGAQFTRESTRIEQQRRYSEFLDELENDVDQGGSNPSGRLITTEQSRALIASQRALIARLRQTASSGRIVLNLEPDSQGADSLPKLPLEDGDRLMVPSVPPTVNVIGTVYNRAAFLHSPDLRLGDYLQDAGGPSRYADRGRMFVIRADGSVIAKDSRLRLFSAGFDSLRMYPGDTLVVPSNTSKTTLLRGLLDWSQVISSFGIGAAAVNVLK